MREKAQEILTVEEMRQVLKIGTNASYNLIHSGAFPVIKIGQSYRIPAIETTRKHLHKNEEIEREAIESMSNHLSMEESMLDTSQLNGAKKRGKLARVVLPDFSDKEKGSGQQVKDFANRAALPTLPQTVLSVCGRKFEGRTFYEGALAGIICKELSGQIQLQIATGQGKALNLLVSHCFCDLIS